MAAAAIIELQGACLFGIRISITPQISCRVPYGRVQVPDLGWGWRGNDDAPISQVDCRGVTTEPPKDIFAPVRERRRLVFDRRPRQDAFPAGFVPNEWILFELKLKMFSMLHNYNVIYVSDMITYQERGRPNSHRARAAETELAWKQRAHITCVNVDFASKEAIDKAIAQYDDHLFYGSKLKVTPWQLPLRHLGGSSWDAVRGGQHFSGL